MSGRDNKIQSGNKHNESALSYLSNRPTLQSILDKHRGPPTIISLLDENQALHNQLKYYNQKLTRMIDYRGFSEAVTRVRTGKKSRMSSRDLKLSHLKKEIVNNDKQIKIQKEDLKMIEAKRDRLVNPAFLVELNNKIEQRKRDIHELKKEIHDIEVENKKELRLGNRDKKKQRRRGETNGNHISALLKEIELVNRKNQDMMKQIEEGRRHIIEQGEYLQDKVTKKLNDLRNQMNKAGLVEDNEYTIEYKKIEKELNEFNEDELKIDSRYEKSIKMQKKELEEATLEHEMVLMKVEEMSKAIEKQTGELLEMIQQAKMSQSPHGVKILDRIKEGIEPSVDVSRNIDDRGNRDTNPLDTKYSRLSNPTSHRHVEEKQILGGKMDSNDNHHRASDNHVSTDRHIDNDNMHRDNENSKRDTEERPKSILKDASRDKLPTTSPDNMRDSSGKIKTGVSFEENAIDKTNRTQSKSPDKNKDGFSLEDEKDNFKGFGEEEDVKKPNKPDFFKKNPLSSVKVSENNKSSTDMKQSGVKITENLQKKEDDIGKNATLKPNEQNNQKQKSDEEKKNKQEEDILGLDFFPNDENKDKKEEEKKPSIASIKPIVKPGQGPIRMIPNNKPGIIKPGGPIKLPQTIPNKQPIKITNNQPAVNKIDDIDEIIDIDANNNSKKDIITNKKPVIIDEDDDDDFNGFGSDIPNDKNKNKTSTKKDVFAFLEEEDNKDKAKKPVVNAPKDTKKQSKKDDLDDMFGDDDDKKVSKDIFNNDAKEKKNKDEKITTVIAQPVSSNNNKNSIKVV